MWGSCHFRRSEFFRYHLPQVRIVRQWALILHNWIQTVTWFDTASSMHASAVRISQREIRQWHRCSRDGREKLRGVGSNGKCIDPTIFMWICTVVYARVYTHPHSHTPFFYEPNFQVFFSVIPTYLPFQSDRFKGEPSFGNSCWKAGPSPGQTTWLILPVLWPWGCAERTVWL